MTVGDTGAGLDEAARQHIFEPFCTNKDVGPGPSLGIAIVYDIVKQSGGYIFVDSGVGKGAMFEIYLPQADRGIESPE